MKAVIATISVLFTISIFAITIIRDVSIDQNCTGYLKRAADANSVETARVQLQKATQYLEIHNLTSGYTSVLWKTPDEDVEFWYNNLKESEAELMRVDSTTSSLEKTNLLMKLRETLLDGGENGDKLTVPQGLSRYPNNLFWGVMLWLSGLVFIGLIIWGLIEFVENA